jgi:hypothetical protein
MRHVSSRTVARWLSALRQATPDRVVTTFRLVHGFRRDLLIGAETAQLLQNLSVRRFPPRP